MPVRRSKKDPLKEELEELDKKISLQKTESSQETSVELAKVGQLRKEKQVLISYLTILGFTEESIAEELDLRLDEIKDLGSKSSTEIVDYYSDANPKENFSRYTSFNISLIRQLRELVKRYLYEQRTSAQYQAAINAIRAQSDLYDKVWNKGVEMNFINTRSAPKETHMDHVDLYKELKKEKKQIDSLLTEMDVIFTRQIKISAKKTNKKEENVDPFLDPKKIESLSVELEKEKVKAIAEKINKTKELEYVDAEFTDENASSAKI